MESLPPELVKAIGYAAPCLLFTRRAYAALACPDVKYTYMESIGYKIRFHHFPRLGVRMWWKKHKAIHRLDGPATEIMGYDFAYFVNWRLHKIGGPAEWDINGNEQWCVDGRRHRVGGPAVMTADGYRAWYQNDLLHNDDGPAEVTANGRVRFYVGGKRIKIWMWCDFYTHYERATK